MSFTRFLTKTVVAMSNFLFCFRESLKLTEVQDELLLKIWYTLNIAWCYEVPAKL